MQNALTGKNGINKSVLQLAAVSAMLIDHCAAFVSNPYVYYIMKLIGRITIVIMCYFVAEGYHKTHNLAKYIARMAIFVAISQIPYYLYMNCGVIPHNVNALIVGAFRTRNVIFTLFVGLCLLTVLKSDYSLLIKLLASFAALRLAKYSDWSYYAILWIVGFGMFYGSKKKQMTWLVVVWMIKMVMSAIPLVITVINTHTLTYGAVYGWLTGFGGLLALPLLNAYNGERGNASKWVFYVFYPLHLLILTIVGQLVF